MNQPLPQTFRPVVTRLFLSVTQNLKARSPCDPNDRGTYSAPLKVFIALYIYILKKFIFGVRALSTSVPTTILAIKLVWQFANHVRITTLDLGTPALDNQIYIWYNLCYD
jgi:hypothetical protein